MRYVTLVVGGLLLGLPTVLPAQQWSAEEEELFAHIRACWETKALEDYAGSRPVKWCTKATDLIRTSSTDGELILL